MASGINIKHDGKKVDIEEILEITRGIGDDYNGTYYGAFPDIKTKSNLTSNKSFFPHNLGNLQETTSLTNLIKDKRGNNYSLVDKGYRPRFGEGNYFYQTIEGTQTQRYYVLKRRENSIELYSSTSKLRDYSPSKSYSSSNFPEKYIPHRLGFRLVGAGGGGQGGWFSEGGAGGGGGAIIWGWIPIYDTPGNNPNPDVDCIFRIYKGGGGGAKGGSEGGAGSSSVIYTNKGDIVASGGAGGFSLGGNGGSFSLVPYYSINQHKGGNGAKYGAYSAPNLSFNISLLRQNISFYSQGGQKGPQSSWGGSQAGSGGGASLDKGGKGGDESGTGRNGTRGSGGGGGSGWTLLGVKSKAGGSGGFGEFSLYY